jgi:hypothetical protein
MYVRLPRLLSPQPCLATKDWNGYLRSLPTELRRREPGGLGLPHRGYLLTCPRTGAWRGSVQVPGSSLSLRLPTMVVWLSFGLRGPGAMGKERLKRGVLSSK